MLILAAACSILVVVLLIPEPALAWGPITHVAQGMQVLATVITPDHPLQTVLQSIPEVFLYGSLAPDIVQGRRLQSRLRRHSHNWAVGLGLLDAASELEEQAFAWGYLAHLAGDVVAHNFYLPARYIGNFNKGIASHILNEARFDNLHSAQYTDLLLKLLALDFRRHDAMLERAIDSPLISFSAHRRIFEGGLKRIRQWDRVIKALAGKPEAIDVRQAELFSAASCGAIEGVLSARAEAPACRYDPMGEQAIRRALASRRNLQRLTHMGKDAQRAARVLATRMAEDLRAHLSQTPFGA